jgi:transcriptional regulator with XRE-family HTH domain
MQDQIQEILKREKLTSAQFADRIGVQRSSVSHVISGRNKPGFDFIRKILEAFTEINADWLITGSGEMYGKPIRNVELFNRDIEVPEDVVTDVRNDVGNHINTKDDSKEATITSDDSEIERIIVFYKDRTFREYRQE